MGKLREVFGAVVVCLLCALLLANGGQVADPGWRVGDVANRDIKAPYPFDYEDEAATQAHREEAATAVAPVYEFDAGLASRLRAKVAQAFDVGRRRTSEALLEERKHGRNELAPETVADIGQDFLRQLGISLRAEDVEALVSRGFDLRIETISNELLAYAMSSYVIADRTYLPPQEQPLSVVRIMNDSREELRLRSFDEIRTVEEMRGTLTLFALEHYPDADVELVRLATSIAKTQIRANLNYNQLETVDRRRDAQADVVRVVQHVARGTSVVRDGDVVSEQQVALLAQLRAHHGSKGFFATSSSIFAFLLVVMFTIHRFARACFRKYTRSPRELAAMGILLVLVAALDRLAVGLANPVVGLIDGGMSPLAFWYIVPVAGVVLLVRILINAETALVLALGATAICGIAMEGQALFVFYFLVSGVTAAWGIGRNRERRVILWSGVMTGMTNAAFVLFLALVRVNVFEETAPADLNPLFDMGFAFAGGVLSAFLVLGLVPLFELGGFVTDLQLLELANLDHPLLRNLMLRAPGTYHHSVMVGALSEAAAEAIGANALLSRVCSYFHDIGKAVRPQYFVENQTDGVDRHERLTPYQSAQVIIDHVRDGGAIAREHKLPKPIIDNIYMHHGDGLVFYFYVKARETDPDVDPDDFRYPGPRPNTREAGIIMLADKIEAACRSIRNPTPENISDMIRKIINSVMAEGQLQDCPLTLKELYIIADTFKKTVLAIHHHRIAYPDKPLPVARPAGATQERPPQEAVITLEMPAGELVRPRPTPPESPQSAVDWESPDYLPTEEREWTDDRKSNPH